MLGFGSEGECWPVQSVGVFCFHDQSSWLFGGDAIKKIPTTHRKENKREQKEGGGSEVEKKKMMHPCELDGGGGVIDDDDGGGGGGCGCWETNGNKDPPSLL